MEPADRVAEVVLRDRLHLWPHTCFVLARRLSYDAYRQIRTQGWPSSFATDLEGTLLGEFALAMDELQASINQELVNKRRARVLELLAGAVVRGKYTRNVNHELHVGDTAVSINGVRQTPGLLDVCFWASCCASGEFYDCKANVQYVEHVTGKVKLLSGIYHGLFDREDNRRSRVGVISFGDVDYVKAVVRDCPHSDEVEVYGEQTFLTQLPAVRVCNCRPL